MTIEVVSTTEPVAAVKEEKSAPEAKTAPEQKVEKEVTDSEPVDKKEVETDGEKPKKKGGFQRRIDKLNAAKADAQREAEYWKQQALKSASEPKPEPKVEAPKTTADGKPNPELFDSHSEYVEALTDWKIEQKEKAANEKAEKAKLETEQQKVVKTHLERVKAFAEKTADFNEVLESVDDVQLSPAVREIVLSSDNGPELMYELAKNRAEFERICTLSPLAAAKELGKIESRLSTPEPIEIKKTTKAPQPISPVGSKGGRTEKSITDPTLTQKEYEALRAKQRSA